MSIELNSMKTNSFYILIRASELKVFQNLELVRYGLNDYSENKSMSKYRFIILLICRNISNKNKNLITFSNEELKILKKIRPNQIRLQGMKHHRSSGTIYSQGYTAKYEKIGTDLRSFNEYVTKKKTSSKLDSELMKNHNLIEMKIYKHVYLSLTECARYCHNIFEQYSSKISKLQHHFDLHYDMSDGYIKKLVTSGVLNAHLCINAMTEDSHTEQDSSYTLISVPKQEDPNFMKLSPKFLFHLNDTNTVEIKMKEGIVMIYSGYALNHHQMLNKTQLKKNTFINLASYGNKRLFQNMLKSFERSIGMGDDNSQKNYYNS